MGLIIDSAVVNIAPPSVLKKVGVTSIGRYLGWDGVGGRPNGNKNLTKAEAAGLHAEGISIFLPFEYSATAALNGANQGHADGSLALEQVGELGAPDFVGVYFAVDFDAQDYAPGLPNTPANALAKLGPIGDYFQAIKEMKPRYTIGGYGGYWVIKRLLDAKLISLSWQTIAWSGGNEDARIDLLQTVSKAPIAGTDLNTHISKKPSWGQWNPGSPPKPPVPPPPHKSITFDVPPGIKKVTVSWE